MDKVRWFFNDKEWGRRSLIFACLVSIALLTMSLFNGCVTVNPVKLPQQEVVVKVVSEKGELKADDKISRSMEIRNTSLEFSTYTRIHGDTAYISLTSVHSWASESMWYDFKLIKLKELKKIVMYLNNPGGSAFDGFGITDEIRLLKKSGVHVTCEASGIVASAAIPIMLICDKRVASQNTVFLIHPASIYKMFASETLKDVEAQADMLKLARNKYADIVQERSNLDRQTILNMLDKESWFDVGKALKWGMLDEVI